MGRQRNGLRQTSPGGAPSTKDETAATAADDILYFCRGLCDCVRRPGSGVVDFSRVSSASSAFLDLTIWSRV